MYNEQLKMRFLRDMEPKPSTERMYRAVFKVTEPYEAAWGADICTKSGEDLISVVSELAGFGARNRWQKVRALKIYVKWCIGAGVDGAINGLDVLDHSLGLEKVRNSTVSGPAQLQGYLNALYEEEDCDFVDNVYRCYVWLAFFGVPEDQLTEIRCDQVDLNEMVVHCNGERLPIYRHAIPALQRAKEYPAFKYEHPNYEYEREWRDRATGDTIVRGFRQITKMSMRSRLSRDARNAYDRGDTLKQLSYKGIRMSGLFYEIKEIEEETGRSYDFLEAADKYMAGKTYRLDKTRVTLDVIRRQIANDLKQDYERWKLAHNI